MKCINCRSKKLKEIFTLGSQPISSAFYSNKKFNLKKYPLNLFECSKCKLIQFSTKTPVREMYGSSYGYKTSLSKNMIQHLHKKYLILNKKLNFKDNSNIIDIGSNDGSFLNFFASKSKNLQIFGIDPSAQVFKKNYKKNIYLINDFFSKSKLFKFINKNKLKIKKFSLITSFAMFYDLLKPNSFCKDINNLLSENGLWISEFSYFPLLLKNLTYDQICHEHVAYYTLSTFKKIIEKNNLKIIDFTINEINGGSIEVVCAKKNSSHKTNKRKIFNQIKFEKRINHTAYKRFGDRVNNVKNNIITFLNMNPNRVVGYGASTKGNVILNHCKITNENLPFICDANKFKINKFTPGSNIKIISKKKMRKMKPDYLFVLIWSFRSEVIKEEIQYIKKGGKLVFHLPRFHIVDKQNYKKYLKKKISSESYDF